MFGKNPIRHQQSDPTLLAVEAIFYTLQGEGPLAGSPALFIRLAGCNLACTFCDTQFETQAENLRPVVDILAQIERDFTAEQRRLVVLTGGEPMRQNWTYLANGLLQRGTRHIQVETAGTLWQKELEGMLCALLGMHWITFVCSPKTPKVHPRIEEVCHDWKYIIRAGEVDGDDGLPNRGTQQNNVGQFMQLYRPTARGGTIWLSPCDDYDPVKNNANQSAARDLCLKHGYRLSLQMHKIVGVE